MSNIATPADLTKLWGFAVLFHGKDRPGVALVFVDEILTEASASEILVGSAQSRKLFRIAHDILRRRYRGVAQKRFSEASQQGLAFAGKLLQLPWAQREAYMLYVCADFSYEDIAAICGCPIGSIRSRINRAKHALAAAGLADVAQQ